MLIGLFLTRKFKPAEHNHKYAVLIPARNEEPVIANLIKSIKRQDYPQELITIFVVADNCTDNTAKVALENGAICYEHFNPDERTKGFALKYLFEKIEEDYGITSFEGYFIFDSDNLLKKDYISRMNDSFDAGEKIITSYRSTKQRAGLHRHTLCIGLDQSGTDIVPVRFFIWLQIFREQDFYFPMKLSGTGGNIHPSLKTDPLRQTV